MIGPRIIVLILYVVLIGDLFRCAAYHKLSIKEQDSL